MAEPQRLFSGLPKGSYYRALASFRGRSGRRAEAQHYVGERKANARETGSECPVGMQKRCVLRDPVRFREVCVSPGAAEPPTRCSCRPGLLHGDLLSILEYRFEVRS